MHRPAIASLLLLLAATGAIGADARDLARRLEPFLACLGGREASFALDVEASFEVDRKRVAVTGRLERHGDAAFSLELRHPEHSLGLLRGAERTVLLLPAHRTALVGEGKLDGGDVLAPAGLLARLVSEDTAAQPFVISLSQATGPALAPLLTALLGLSSEDGSRWTSPALGNATIDFPAGGDSLEVRVASSTLRLSRGAAPAAEPATAIPDGFTVTAVARQELERVVCRGVRRALEVIAPAPSLVDPPQERRRAAHGELRWVDGQRLVLLHGTPREIGEAHGKLLGREIRHCADSVLYLVGAAQTVLRGKWFLDDIRAARRRLERFIPADHLAENDALADASGLTREEIQLANVFPELFHCSGFALFGKATAGGKLYHGRVLDYMTVIGLQDAAGTFVVAPAGKIPFVNVGYAGFTGSVSGMNAKQISLGEMGGRGEGQWDGVPMATLMRRALEECSTLDQVKKLWQESPRTCEYYYVFADGKLPDAVGVAATPQRIDFVGPGQAHPLLGAGIPDAVVLSAGDRLEKLRARVEAGHGSIDVEKAIALMCRPVAMKSNLHNVLFVPQDLELHVANATRGACAAERPYVRFELRKLLEELGAVAGR